MTSRIAPYSILIAALAMGGCYESEVPIASSDASVIDPDLVGAWEHFDPDNDGSMALLFLQFDDREYFVRYDAEDWGGDTFTVRCRAYIVPANGVPFLNVQAIEDDEENERLFWLFRYAIEEDGTLTMRMVDEKLLKPSPQTSEELRALIEQNLENDDLYGDPGTFRRAG